MKNTERVRRNNATKSAPYQLKMPGEFKVVRLRECAVDNPEIESPPQIVNFWRKYIVNAPWFKETQECLCVFLLNTRHRLLGFELVGLGTLDTVFTTAREVYRPAIFHGAAAILIAHNHPSGVIPHPVLCRM
jgi:DNA repair protein RadC